MDDGGDSWAGAMRAGDYERAWDHCAATLAARDPAGRDDPARPYHQRWVWDGRPYRDREVLVRCYHGLGDTLQFARFLPLLAAAAARVTVEVQPSLIALLAPAFPAIAFRPFDPARPLKPHDCDLEISEMPFALRAAPDAAPAAWLAATPAVLPAGTVGLCHMAGDWDAGRWLPEPLLAPVAVAHPCVTLVAVPSGLRVLNPAGCPLDMGETAALVAACDLVVTVDTMIAHLAGALGRPTWLLLKAAPDWRWDPAARTTPWYPTMRLYAQARDGDWQGVVNRAAQDLSINTERAFHGQHRDAVGSRLLG